MIGLIAMIVDCLNRKNEDFLKKLSKNTWHITPVLYYRYKIKINIRYRSHARIFVRHHAKKEDIDELIDIFERENPNFEKW